MSKAAQPPPALLNAIRLMLLRSAVGVIAAIVALAQWDDFKHRYLRQNPRASAADATAQLTIATSLNFIILVFYVFLAFRVGKGENWARIVTFVIAGLGIVGATVSLGQPDPPLSRALGIVVAVIDVAVVVLLASGPSNRFFKRG
jgi:small-conductance mechanosensitive channel